MAFWPFGRKRRKVEKNDEKGKPVDDAAQQPTREAQRSVASVPSKLTKRLSKSSRKGERSQSQTRTGGTGGRDVAKQLPPVPKLPEIPNLSSGGARLPLAERFNEAIPRTFTDTGPTTSQVSLQPENFTAQGVDALPPTLRPRRTNGTEDNSVPRKRSSKRGSAAREREKEIKEMSGPSSPIPIPRRPQSYASGILAQDKKKFQGGLNRHLERPASEISLPQPESVRSSISNISEWQQNFKVSALDALSPRPTIKFSESPRHAGSRASMRKDKGPAIPEEDFNSRARMDDLADDLDAKGLRELMDRDQRRRERKQKRDQEKLRKKLEQRNIDAERIRSVPKPAPEPEPRDEEPAPQKLETADPSRQTSGEVDRENMQSPSSWLQDPSRRHSKDAAASPTNDPFSEPTVESPGLASDRGSEKESPIIETAKAVRLSSASMSPPSVQEPKHSRNPSKLSNFVNAPEDGKEVFDKEAPKVAAEPPLTAELAADDFKKPPAEESMAEEAEGLTALRPVPERKDSDSSRGRSWTSFFKRSKTRKEPPERNTATPTSFSNTSRESFARSVKAGQSPPPAVAPTRSFKRPGSGTPTRTQSRFREDLPELPSSGITSRLQSPDPSRLQSHDASGVETSEPPSRIQSPDPASVSAAGIPPSPYIDDAAKVDTLVDDSGRGETPLGDVHPAFREEVATRSRGQSMRESEEPGPSAVLLSQSLASVDSEGSWLSGRPAKRSSVPIGSLRESQASLGGTLKGSDEGSHSPERGQSPVFQRQDPSRSQPSGPGALSAQLKDVSSGHPADTASAATALARHSSSGERPKLRYDTVAGFHASPHVVSPPASALPAHAHEGVQAEIGDTNRISTATAAPAAATAAASAVGGQTSPSPDTDLDSPLESPVESPTSPDSPSQPNTSATGAQVRRATSVDYGRSGGHARQVSSGSARLLEIRPRASGEGKRDSLGAHRLSGTEQERRASGAEDKTEEDATAVTEGEASRTTERSG